jgi:hypothetical protein
MYFKISLYNDDKEIYSDGWRSGGKLLLKACTTLIFELTLGLFLG